MAIAVIDTETTGLDPEKDDVVELAVVVVDGPPWRIERHFDTLVKPKCPIGLEAMAVHHISEAMVASAPSLSDATYVSPLTGDDVTHVAAHNAAFDSQFVKTAAPWICTYRCAMHVWPEAPRHSNQVLRYWLPSLNLDLYKDQGLSIMEEPPHRALPDAWTTAHLLMRLLRERTVEELVELTTKPILLKTVRFGKHKGELWSDVPTSYLHWIASKDFSADEIHTAMYHIQAKRA